MIRSSSRVAVVLGAVAIGVPGRAVRAVDRLLRAVLVGGPVSSRHGVGVRFRSLVDMLRLGDEGGLARSLNSIATHRLRQSIVASMDTRHVDRRGAKCAWPCLPIFEPQRELVVVVVLVRVGGGGLRAVQREGVRH